MKLPKFYVYVYDLENKGHRVAKLEYRSDSPDWVFDRAKTWLEMHDYSGSYHLAIVDAKWKDRWDGWVANYRTVISIEE